LALQGGTRPLLNFKGLAVTERIDNDTPSPPKASFFANPLVLGRLIGFLEREPNQLVAQGLERVGLLDPDNDFERWQAWASLSCSANSCQRPRARNSASIAPKSVSSVLIVLT
jgi:hypothetical protein